MLRQLRRAPARVLSSVLALALAVSAIGVLAIPAVSEGTLHELAADDGLADIVVATSPLDSEQVQALATIDGVDSVEAEIDRAITLPDGTSARLVGLGLGPSQTMDRLRVTSGRAPEGLGEVVTGPDVTAIGDEIRVGDQTLSVVGHGGTIWWSDQTALFTDLTTAEGVTGVDGTNRLVITAEQDDLDSLHAISDQVRAELAADGERYVDFPVYLPDGSTPIDADIQQVSQLIGMLGVVAGLVALVLLSSTTNTLITERTREVAVMRALGARRRPLRRRLRRIALAIAAAALLIGLPAGVLIANLIARLVLERFVGVTPDLAWSWPVLVGSAVFGLLGARLVAARAARRVTSVPLAEALRDRDGNPYGRRISERGLARIPLGAVTTRMSMRAAAHKRARSAAVVLQIGSAVGAAILIVGLTLSVNQYNESVHAPWRWESLTVANEPGLPFDAETVVDAGHGEAGILTVGEVQDWDMDVFGIAPESPMFAPTLREGRLAEAGAREAVVSAGFVARTDLAVGTTMTLQLASGTASYTVVGTVEDGGRTVYLDRSTLAEDLGAPGMANIVWSMEAAPRLSTSVDVDTSTAGDLASADEAGRRAIVVIFGSIAAIVAGVAALAVMSTMAVDLYERRHEMAAMQALGATRAAVRRVVRRELLALAAAGSALGVVAGWLGNKAVVASFESSNAVDIGAVFSVVSVPLVTLAAMALVSLLPFAAVRTATRRPVAVTLRGAA